MKAWREHGKTLFSDDLTYEQILSQPLNYNPLFKPANLTRETWLDLAEAGIVRIRDVVDYDGWMSRDSIIDFNQYPISPTTLLKIQKSIPEKWKELVLKPAPILADQIYNSVEDDKFYQITDEEGPEGFDIDSGEQGLIENPKVLRLTLNRDLEDIRPVWASACVIRALPLIRSWSGYVIEKVTPIPLLPATVQWNHEAQKSLILDQDMEKRMDPRHPTQLELHLFPHPPQCPDHRGKGKSPRVPPDPRTLPLWRTGRYPTHLLGLPLR